MKGKVGFVLALLVMGGLAFWAGSRNAQTKQEGSVSPVQANTSERSSVADVAEAKQTPFEFLTEDGAITISKYNGSSLTVTIPNTINGLPVKRIGDRAFYISRITSITIPNGVVSIGDSAFYQCSDLNSAAIPASVTTIGHAAFQDCKSLTGIRLPKALTRIGPFAFSGCNRLQALVIPDNVTTVEENSFRECSALTQVVVGKGVRIVESFVFVDCISLTEMYFLGDAPKAGDHIFSYRSRKPVVYHLAGTSGWTSIFEDCEIRLCQPKDIPTFAQAL